MTSVVAGGFFNAITFAGAGYLFQHPNRNDYEEEMKRRNKALENLAKDKEKWYERQVEKKNRIAQLRQELPDANKDIKFTNHALDSLRKVYSELQEDIELVLSHYYKQSDEMKDYQHTAVGAFGLGTDSVAGFVLKKTNLSKFSIPSEIGSINCTRTPIIFFQ